MSVILSSNNCNYPMHNSGMEFLSIFEDALTLALLLYSLQHLKNIAITLKQRQEVISTCSTNAQLAQNFPTIDKKIFTPYILSEFLCMASSCCFALAKFYGIDTKFYGHEINSFHLATLEALEWKTIRNFYKPNIDELMRNIII